MSGLDLQRELRRQGHEIPVIVLTGHASVPLVVEAMKQGATEFLQKPVDDDVLLEAIRRSLASDVQRHADLDKNREVRKRIAKLTAREREVLQRVVAGLSSKEIAARLSVSFKTVEAHRARIMRKMEAGSVAHLVRTIVSADTRVNPGRRLLHED
jgi:two-component system response regulator FixJ